MRTFVSVLRVQLLQQYRPGRDDRKRQNRLLLTGLALVPFAVMLFGLFSALAAAGRQLGAPALGIELALVTGMVAAVMFGMTYIISTLYYGRDMNLLLPLPLPPVAILWAKFVLILLGELISLAIFYWPAVLGFAAVSKTGPAFWLLTLPVFITLPIIPLCLATLLSMGLMAATSRRINRDAVRIVLSLVSLGLLLGFQTFQRYAVGGSFGNGLTSEGMAAMQRLLADGGLLDMVGRYFPPSVWAARGLTGDVRSLFLYLAAVVVAGLVTAFVAQRLLLRGLVGVDEKRATGARLTKGELRQQAARTTSPVLAVFRRENRMFNRTPVFLMQGLTPFLLAPIYVLMPMISSGGLHGAIAAVSSQRIDGRAAMIAFGVVQFMFLTNPIASTAISRDGRFIWYGRTLPVRPIDEINGKLLHVLVWSGAFVLIACGLLISVVHPSPLLAIAFTIANLSGAVTVSELGMLTDIRSPRLAWTNPQQAFKGNFNGVVTNLVYLLALTVIALPLAFFLRGNPTLACSLAAITFAVIAAGFHQRLARTATEQYDQLQAD